MASSRTTATDPPADAPPHGEGVDQLLTFRVGERRYGCPLEAVREVFVARPATRLPGAPAHVLGVLNLRGALLTVLDVGRWLSEAEGSPLSGHILLVEADGRAGGCRVDGLGRAVPMPPLERPAGGGNVGAGGIVLGIGEVDGELVAVLDLPRLVSQSLLFPGER